MVDGPIQNWADSVAIRVLFFSALPLSYILALSCKYLINMQTKLNFEI